MPTKIRYAAVGDSAMSVEFGQEIDASVNAKVISLFAYLQEHKIEGIVDISPTFCSLFIIYDPRILLFTELKAAIEKCTHVSSFRKAATKKIIEIPVCYEDAFAPDMQNVMQTSGLTRESVIRLHCAVDYLIYMLGFLPGFAYLGGLDARLATPRLETPRRRVAAGSVGIGGSQTGIYPLPSPGGWQLIGKTPLKVFDTQRSEPILYKAGEYIRFRAINAEEYQEIHERMAANDYTCKVILEQFL